MARVIIVSKTRMANDNVCVGGVDFDNKRSIRLMNENGYHESQDECPYEIWDVWDVDYVSSNQRPAPHVEDVNVINRNKRGVLKNELRNTTEFAKLLRQSNVPVFTGGLMNCFDGKLKSTQYGTLFINEEDVPHYSTCFWICDRLVRRSDFRGKVRYNYDDGTRNWGYNISYVGLSDPSDTIPMGSIIRLSLAHWWSPSDSEDEDRCYLQLSGCLCEADVCSIDTSINLAVKLALKGYDVQLKEHSTCYDNTDIPIMFLSLSKLFQGQDYLVLSRTAAIAIHRCKNNEERKKVLSECIVTYSKEAKCYGVVLYTSKTIANYVFDELVSTDKQISDDIYSSTTVDKQVAPKVSSSKWSIKEERSFTDEELSGISSARVVASQYGNSVCFTLVGGGQSYIPCATDSPLTVGEEVNPSALMLITLQRSGDADIYRVTVCDKE